MKELFVQTRRRTEFVPITREIETAVRDLKLSTDWVKEG